MRRKRRHARSSSDEDESPSQSKSATQTNSNLRAGRILQMTLKNFMCHSFLEVEFSGNVNFLTGNNGSGKSAILAALSLGLGCKAKTTNRGDISNIKAFIKFGCNSASIEIVLNNEGPQAYKQEEFGSKITVQRSMAVSGGSTYKIKNEHGKVVSKKTKDLHDLTSALNIQVDNPVCILSQDTARNFLNATDPKMRFNLFYRATRLDHLERLFAEAVKKKKMAIHEFNVKKNQEAELLKKTRRLERKIAEARKIEEMKEKLTELQAEKAWGNTLLNERQYLKQKHVVTNISLELEKIEATFAEQKNVVEKVQEEKRDLEARLREICKSQDENEQPVKELTMKIRSVEKEINEKNSLIASVQRQVDFRKQDLQSLREMINSYNNRCSQIEREKQSKQDNIARLETTRKEKTNLQTNYEEEFNKLSTHSKEVDRRLDSIKQQIHASTNKINGLNDRLITLQRETNNPYAIYGPHYVRLMNAIESEAQNFTRPPIGPIGTQVSIKDRKWTLAVESYLKAGLLCSFIVNSQQDQNRLRQIIKELWPREGGGRPPSIIATKFVDKPHDVSKYLVASHANCTRMYDVLSVPNTVVMNCLIDQAKIESVLLIPDKKFGFGILKDQRTVPRNCRIAITPTGDTIHPDPNYRFYSGRQTTTKFIQVDSSDAVRQCEIALGNENQTRAELRDTYQNVQQETVVARENIPKIKQSIAKCQHDLEVIARKINQLQTQPDEIAGNVDDLKNEAEELEKIIKEKASSVHETRLQIEELESKVQDLKEEVRQFDSSRKESRKAKEDVQNLINTHGYRSQVLINEYNKVKRRVEELQTSVASETEQMNNLQTRWEKLCENTEAQNGARPEVIRRSDDIEEEINRLNEQMQDLGRYNIVTLQEDLRVLSELIEAHRITMNDMEITLMELQDAKAGRKRKLLETKKYMKDYAIFNFTNFLHCRKYEGNMAINYDDETLDMIVIPHAGTRGVTPTTNLSGGERSFSTVAFLYSLWKTLDFPFYILDEFDVYMDPQNRNLVIKILIDHAKKNKEVQYVFLTPQDISFIKDPEVAIHRLEDPERIQHP